MTLSRNIGQNKMNKIQYFKDLANVNFGDYVFHFNFTGDNSSTDAYRLNNSGDYSNLSGYFSRFSLSTDFSDQITFYTLPSDAYSDSEEYTFLFNYEGPQSLPCNLFSTIVEESNTKVGFAISINHYNDLAIEYYKDGIEYNLYETDLNLDTKGLLFIKGNKSSVNIGIYNLTKGSLTQESFPIELSGIILSGIRIGSLDYPTFSKTNADFNGKLKDFVFLKKNINDTELEILFNQFVYNIEDAYEYNLFSERYSSNLSPHTSGIFDTFTQFSNSCFTKTFIEQTGSINGLISGSTIGNTMGVSGKVNFNNYEVLKSPMNTFFTGIKKTGELVTTSSVTSLTGYKDEVLTQIYDFCQDKLIDFKFRSGLFKTVNVDSVQNLFGYVEETITLPTGTVVLTGFETILNPDYITPVNPDNQNLNYVYSFDIVNNINYITKTESLTFVGASVDPDFTVNRTSEFGFRKVIRLSRLNNFINELGVENVIINNILDQNDIVEIYNISKTGSNVVLNDPLYISNGSKNIYIGPSERSKIITFNGVTEFPVSDYTITNYNITSNRGVDNKDFLDLDFVKDSGSAVKFDYTGQNTEPNVGRDFLFLNGIKLISGYQYNLSQSNVNFINENIPVTGSIDGFNVLIGYTRYTGYNNFFNIYAINGNNNRFFKGSNVIYLNGIKLNFDSFLETSVNDPFYNPTFSDKTDVTIYNNEDNFFNM